LCWVFIVEHRISVVVVGRGYFFIAVLGLLIGVVSLFAEHRLQVHRLQ